MCVLFYHVLIPGCIYLRGRKIESQESTILPRNLDSKEKAIYNLSQVSGLSPAYLIISFLLVFFFNVSAAAMK